MVRCPLLDTPPKYRVRVWWVGFKAMEDLKAMMERLSENENIN
jgi:hypothetical protein